MKAFRFIKDTPPYAAGEVAGFSPEKALSLQAAGVGFCVEPDAGKFDDETEGVDPTDHQRTQNEVGQAAPGSGESQANSSAVGSGGGYGESDKVYPDLPAIAEPTLPIDAPAVWTAEAEASLGSSTPESEPLTAEPVFLNAQGEEPGSVEIPDDWPSLHGRTLISIAAKLSADPIRSKDDAVAAIQAEIARRASLKD